MYARTQDGDDGALRPPSRLMHEQMLAGDLYIADDPELAAASERALRLMHQINTMDPTAGSGMSYFCAAVFD